MSIMEHWRLALTPLSPVHLGTGQDYTPTGYVIDGGALHEFDALAALAALPEAERQRLNVILDGRPTQAMLRAVQSFFYGNRERMIAAARHSVRVNPTVEAFYQERVGQVSQRESTGAVVQSRLEIERTAWSSATGTAIVPGSGIKGAIRTALLDSVNVSERLRKVPDRKTGKQRDEKNAELQQRLLDFRAGQFEKDPLRLLRLADSTVAEPDQFATEVYFALNRKKKPVLRGGQRVQSQAEQQGLYQLLECLPPLIPRVFAGTLSIQGTGGVESRHWPSRQFSFSEIAAACNRFYRGHLDRELGLMRSMGYLDQRWAERIDALLASPVGRAIEANRAFLLRIGRHSGAESVTLNGVRNIKIMKGRGETPDYLDEAKTLWLAGHERQSQRELLPFGWVLVEACQDPDELADWPEPLRNQDMAPWRAEVLRRRQGLREQLEASQRKEAEALRAAAAAEQAAREHEQRLASMTEEERRIASLLDTLAKEHATKTLAPSSRVASERVELLREALDWDSDTLRQQAAEAIQETVRALPWSKKAKAERQADLERLRQPKAS